MPGSHTWGSDWMGQGCALGILPGSVAGTGASETRPRRLPWTEGTRTPGLSRPVLMSTFRPRDPNFLPRRTFTLEICPRNRFSGALPNRPHRPTRLPAFSQHGRPPSARRPSRAPGGSLETTGTAREGSETSARFQGGAGGGGGRADLRVVGFSLQRGKETR